jgi:hypothetical protein
VFESHVSYAMQFCLDYGVGGMQWLPFCRATEVQTDMLAFIYIIINLAD